MGGDGGDESRLRSLVSVVRGLDIHRRQNRLRCRRVPYSPARLPLARYCPVSH